MRGSSLNRTITWFTHNATEREVARRYGVYETQLTNWQRLARDGGPVLPSAIADAEFAPFMMRAERSRAAEAGVEHLEVVQDKVAVRLDAATPTGWFAEIALRRTPRHDLRR